MTKKFTQILFNYQKKINREIEKLYNLEIKRAQQPFLRKTLKTLKEFSLRPAKRIRAIFVNYGYLLAGGKNKKEILKTSIFIELIHNYLLIHDDVIDQDKIRRGRPTIHCQYQYQKFSKLTGEKKEHFGLSMAIGAGDMMNAIGYEVLASSNFPSRYKIQTINKLNRILYATRYGQMLELKLRKKIEPDKKLRESDIFEIYKSKTAFYSSVGPLQIGATLAGANQKFLKKIEKFALPLGIAFQIQDDLSDIESDLKKGQPTLIRKGASLQYCQRAIKRLMGQSKEALNLEKSFPKKEKQFLLDLIDYIIKKEG